MISTRTGAKISINGQYIKDLSFENPKAPIIYTQKNLNPEISVSVDINATKLQENVFEVALSISAEAKNKDEVLFIIELIQGGIFKIENIENSLIEDSLFVDCPYLLFPFARKTIIDLTIAANFPPLTIDLIDFAELYRMKKEKVSQK